MSSDYSEDSIVEQPIMDILSQDLAWEVANVEKNESFGENGTIGRDSEADVLLKYRFIVKVSELNSGTPLIAIEKAFEILNSFQTTKDLAEINHGKYTYLKEGVPVSYKNDKGVLIEKQRVKIFDFNNPRNNDFLAVQQL